jgi:hypothetical protein
MRPRICRAQLGVPDGLHNRKSRDAKLRALYGNLGDVPKNVGCARISVRGPERHAIPQTVGPSLLILLDAIERRHLRAHNCHRNEARLRLLAGWGHFHVHWRPALRMLQSEWCSGRPTRLTLNIRGAPASFRTVSPITSASRTYHPLRALPLPSRRGKCPGRSDRSKTWRRPFAAERVGLQQPWAASTTPSSPG